MQAVVPLFIAATLWGALGVVGKFSFQEGVSAMETAFWRGTIGGACFLLHAKLTGKLRFDIKDVIPILLFSLFAVVGLEVSYLYAVQEGGAAFAAITLYSAPVWVALISRIFFRETISKFKAFCLMLTLLGVAGVCLSGSSGVQFTVTALFWGLVSGFSYALFYIFGKYILKNHEPVSVYAVAFPVASLMVLPLVEFTPKSTIAWTSLTFSGVASTYAAYLFYSVGLKRTDATKASVIASLEPVVAALLAYLVWNETLAPLGYASALLVLTGITLMVRKS